MMPKDNWFTEIGYPVRKSNTITPLVDGETTWQLVASELKKARNYIHICTWRIAVESELIRDPQKTFTEPLVRAEETILQILLGKAKEGVKIRLLLWDFPFLKQDKLIQAIGTQAQDNFEILEEPHPKLIGSFHQKTVTIDGRIAFVGGMNLLEEDWDTSSHTIYDYRRTPHHYSGEKRSLMQKQKKVPDFPPRHDLATRIKGPLVADVEANFVQRWNATKESGVMWSNSATTAYKIAPPQGEGTLQGQIIRTMPPSSETPSGETAILDTYIKAIRNAKSYIYIEDQFFRYHLIAQELAWACKRNPQLILIIVTIPDYLAELEVGQSWKLFTPSSYWTANAFKLIKAVRKDFCLFYLQMFDYDQDAKPLFVATYTHAKIMIIDDIWWTIGSCNINDRGFLYEGEINIASLDPLTAKELRISLWSEHLEAPCPEDVTKAASLWYQHAQENFKAWKSKAKPISRVFPFAQRGPILPVTPSTWL